MVRVHDFTVVLPEAVHGREPREKTWFTLHFFSGQGSEHAPSVEFWLVLPDSALGSRVEKLVNPMKDLEVP